MHNRELFPWGLSGTIAALSIIVIVFIIIPLQPESNLTAAPSNAGASVRLTWTAPGDDGNVGQASVYDLRYSLDSLTDENWNAATQVENETSPKPSGQEEVLIVSGLEQGTKYFFALKSADEAQNWSNMSNVVSITANSTYICGDVSGDGITNMTDAITIVNYVYLDGEIFVPFEYCDVNCDTAVNVSDAVSISNYIFNQGTAPCDCDF
ncbi:MAG: hypothetical protein GWO41_18010 [candidate division Zixibacteria bacterium]|nr:hypothetical protein [candidate division Zixibacteria bacterium]NIR68306.1 hypothetical protein [candidate division Zixibacteria bacterium]NIS18280.1 hypothetical protein [candidate division Zixibacteria bacterium]NIS49472.1 hypothetical protein [candidate division Zixibacteria bacterium]NIT54588.1 hypothetical protein [candidate division Zixibacteria bacterium]